ncbi:MAG: hypothetical protein ACK2U9_16525 [Anaerolineae bacterium]
MLPQDGHFESQPQAWLHARVRLMPRLLVEASPRVRGVFDQPWAPMRVFAQEVSCLPAGLFDYLLDSVGGFVQICVGESRYEPGAAVIGQQTVQNVAYVSVEDLADGNERPLHVLAHLIDHYLGCGGEPDGPWLSEGAGVVPRWLEAGARLPRLFELGADVTWVIDRGRLTDATVALTNVQDYFAQSLAYYCRDRRRLNVADPQIWKWLRTNLWNNGFWRGLER